MKIGNGHEARHVKSARRCGAELGQETHLLDWNLLSKDFQRGELVCHLPRRRRRRREGAYLGLKSGRSFFDARDDNEAREKFDAELKRTRCGFFGLSCLAGFGYGTHKRQVAAKDFSKPDAAPGAAGARHPTGRSKEA